MTHGHRNTGRMHSIPLGMAGCPLHLHTDSTDVAEIASGFFPAIVSQNAKEARADLTLLVRNRRDTSAAKCGFPIFRGRNQYIHADYGSDGSVWFDLKARVVSGIVSEGLIEDVELFRRNVLSVIAGVLAPSLGLVGLHAGCVVRGGKAVLLAASSGVGKSTLTLALALRGWNLLSDDWTFLASGPTGLRVWGMRTSLKLLPDAVRYYPGLAGLCPAPALNGEVSFEVDPWRLFGVGRAIDATPVAIVRLERSQYAYGDSRVHVSRCDPEEMQTALLKEIEELPAGINQGDGHRLSLIERVCALPGFNVRMSGYPATIAADLDPILSEYVCG
jgi:hypothetical protein